MGDGDELFGSIIIIIWFSINFLKDSKSIVTIGQCIFGGKIVFKRLETRVKYGDVMAYSTNICGDITDVVLDGSVDLGRRLVFELLKHRFQLV